MKKTLTVALCSLLAVPALSAQDNTADMLQRAIRFYDDVQVERALTLLSLIHISEPTRPY